ncbi:hypothetical protein L6164_023466 [Bauhinia variegata]|uniref:Uncharacterized protein n=1 Tax=Bauhinia variegata TaxID=167791 RepID=A0ACB9MIA1_BAUVA|nr:hypothetical protein L6164_023466 [Bauhinia variegata]
MEANKFSITSPYQVLTILIFTILCISNIKAASSCNNTVPSNSSTTIPSNYTTTPFYSPAHFFNFTITPSNSSTPIPSNSTAIPSNSTTTPYNSSTTIPSNSSNSTIPSNSTTFPSNSSTPIPSNSSIIIPSNSTTINENTTIPQNQTFITYLKGSCNSTTYPSLCYSSLLPYASKIEGDNFKLCNISLTLALKAAYSASSTITKLSCNNNLTETEASVVQDCLDNAKDSIEQLLQSLQAMEHLDGIDKEFQLSSIKTWVSAAITDYSTCSDGFDEQNLDGTVRDKIRKKILNAERMTSNALYFINNLPY